MEEKKEIELIDYLDVIWRKKLLIVIPTFILMFMAGYCSFRTPRAFAADAIIAPSGMMLQTPGGRLEKIQIVDPMQLAVQINQGSYNADIAAALNLDPYEVSIISAENLRDPQSPQYQRGTDLVLVSTVNMEMDKAQKTLEMLFELVKKDLDALVEVEAQNVDSRIEGLNSKIKEKEVEILENENQMALTGLEITDNNQGIKVQENEILKKRNDIEAKKLEIESVEIEKGRIGDEIKNFQQKITIVDKRAENLQVEMQEAKTRIKELEEQQKQALASKKTEGQAISLLLYSNEIQGSLQYYNYLDEKLYGIKVNRENLILEINKKEELLKQRDNKIRQIETEIITIQANIENNKTQIGLIKTQAEKIKTQITSIKNANETVRTEIQSLKSEIKLLGSQKARITYTELVKAPGPAMMAMGRNPLYMVVIVGFIFGMMFTILAFFIDYIQRHKKAR